MSASFLEIIELSSGDVVLKRSDCDEPLLTLKFSEEARVYLQGGQLDVAKVMFDAGINEFGRQGAQNSATEATEERVLH